MILKRIMGKSMEVINRTERIRNFICSNCKACEVIFISSDEAEDIFNILNETSSEILFEFADTEILKKYNNITSSYISVINSYIHDIMGDVTASYKVNDKICKLSKLYISKVAKLLNMNTDEYVMCILRENMNTAILG